MVRNYIGFKKQLEEIIILRSRNYVNTDCNINMLIHSVFAEIATEVPLMWEIRRMMFFEGINDYDMDITEILEYTAVDEEYISPLAEDYIDGINEYAAKYIVDVIEVADDNGYDMSNILTRKITPTGSLYITDEDLKPRVNSFFNALMSVIPSIKSLEPWMYQLMIRPMVEGIMFNIQDSVPSEMDVKAGNLQYQRFFNAKKELKLKFPQRESIITKQLGTSIEQFNGGL